MHSSPARVDLASVVSSVYAASIDDSLWQTALERSTALLGGAAAVLFVYDKSSARVPIFHGHNLPDLMSSEYDREMASRDERIAFCASHPERLVSYDFLHTDEQAIGSSAYYDWIERRIGCRYYVASLPINNDRTLATLSVQRTKHQGHAQADEIGLMGRLTVDVRRALELRRRLDGISVLAEAGAAALDRCDFGVVATDAAGRVLHANRSAQAMLFERDGVSDEGGVLQPSDTRLLRGVRTALGSATGGGPLRLNRPSGLPPLLMTVIPVEPRYRLFDAIQPTRIVLLVDPASPLEPGIASLRNIFGLTRSEARLAKALLQGATIAEAARQMGNAPATLRVHLNQIFRKTGTHRQGDLLLKLLRSMPMLG